MAYIGPIVTFCSGVVLTLEWSVRGGDWRLASGLSFAMISILLAIRIHRKSHD